MNQLTHIDSDLEIFDVLVKYEKNSEKYKTF